MRATVSVRVRVTMRVGLGVRVVRVGSGILFR